jgi:3-deoxy-manno-octulosonate cytidylyltransferase (CMP-KDO synthetase)
LETVVVIPARYGSTRFPGKPLTLIKGKSLLHRTWSIAKAARGVDEVIIATDDNRIAEHAVAFGANVKMTDVDCRNGTERALQSLAAVKPHPNMVINLQGDAVLTPPWVIEALVKAMKQDPKVMVATPAAKISLAQYDELAEKKLQNGASGTMVVFDRDYNALYFSKALIPYMRNRKEDSPIYRHIGIYGFRYPMLERFVELAPTPLEETEGLEQLRILENGFSIKVAVVDYRGRTSWSVDTPEDARIAEQIIEREGELLDDPSECAECV